MFLRLGSEETDYVHEQQKDFLQKQTNRDYQLK